jgi:glycosyltransferase involved in cell wall biosynthesis
VDRDAMRAAIREFKPQLVITEAWQTALTDTAVELAHELEIPSLMVSHGVSLHPFTGKIRDRARALAWLFYRYYRLPRLMRKLSAMTSLSELAHSPRFYDRDLAKRLGTPVHPLGNFAVNCRAPVLARTQREAKILVVGYFSAVKNQLSALEVLRLLPAALCLVFVGPRVGAYYEACVSRAAALGLLPRVRFLEDSECDLAEEIGTSLMLLSTSVTEALPICLLEGMASGTPVVATPVGAVPDLGAGLLSSSPAGQANSAVALWQDSALWEQESRKGQSAYEARFSRERVKHDLEAAVALTVGSLPTEGQLK